MKTHAFGQLPHSDLLSLAPLSAADIATIYGAAAALKRGRGRGRHGELLAGRRLALIFEKDSLRTRFTFDVGVQDLGGSAVFVDQRDVRLAAREPIKDVARNLERWVHGIVLRTYEHAHLEELAAHCGIPVINGLSDLEHPCQALTDFFTLRENWGRLSGRTLAYVGDGNNTCHSLIQAAAKLGVHLKIACPPGYEPERPILDAAQLDASSTGAELQVVRDPEQAVDGADAVYTDVWTSMGQEAEHERRSAAFRGYQVNEGLLARAAPGALFLHCLPAHRGLEVSAGVIDGPASIVYDQAENRLHVQKALLVLLLGRAASSTTTSTRARTSREASVGLTAAAGLSVSN